MLHGNLSAIGVYINDKSSNFIVVRLVRVVSRCKINTLLEQDTFTFVRMTCIVPVYNDLVHAHTDIQTHTLRISHLFCSVLLNVTLPMTPL